LKHQFEATLTQLRNNEWCPICKDQFKKCQDYAEANGGKVLNCFMAPIINFQCGSGHHWNISNKIALKNWCGVCFVEKKEQMKRILEEEAKKKERENEIKQQKLFEEAKKKYLESRKHQSSESIYEVLPKP